MELIDVVVPAAGSGSRMAAGLPKQFCLLGGVPLMVHPLRVFQSLPWVGRMIIVHAKDQKQLTERVVGDFGFENVVLVEGGSSRQESVRRGLVLVSTQRVIVHNAAVALVTRDVVERVAEFSEDCVTTTTSVEVNLVRGNGFAETTVSKEKLKIINSPQCFRTSVLRDCHTRALEAGMSFASETELMLHYQKTIRLVPGPSRNFKITTPFDLFVAEAVLAQDRHTLPCNSRAQNAER